MLVEQVVGIEEAVVLSVFIVDLRHVAVLHELLHHSVSKVLQLDIEVELDVLDIFGCG